MDVPKTKYVRSRKTENIFLSDARTRVGFVGIALEPIDCGFCFIDSAFDVEAVVCCC